MAKMPSISSDQFEYLWQNLSDDSGNIDDLSTEFDLDQLDDTDHEMEYKPSIVQHGVSDLFGPVITHGSHQSSPTHVTTSTYETAAQSIPSTTSYAGHYSFQIGFEHQPKDTKATSWTYSPALHKFFVRMAAPCPIRFKTAMAPRVGSVIRAMMVYSKPEHIQEPVGRCANHAQEKDGHSAPAHLLRCQHKRTQYTCHHLSGRHSLLLPPDQPQPGVDWVTNLFQFMCFSSCVGGLNRRPVKLVFMLESKDGQVLGRQSVEVRICACPGRDRKQEEHALSPPSAAVPKPLKHHASNLTAIDLSGAGSSSKRLRQQEDVFTLTVVGRHNFQILSQIRDSLELAGMISGVQVQQYRQQQAAIGRTTSLQHTQVLPPMMHGGH